MKLTKGNELTADVQRDVLRAFVHRLTIENNYPKLNPCGATIGPITDKQWLAEHAFYVNNNGELSGLHTHCEPYYLAN